MKRSILARMLSMMLVVLCVVGLAACGSSKSAAIGTYKISTVETSGMTLNWDEFLTTMGMDESLTITVDLKEDGNFVIDMTAMDEGTMEGTWTESSNTVTMTIDGEEETATYKDGTLTMAIDGLSMSFTKN